VVEVCNAELVVSDTKLVCLLIVEGDSVDTSILVVEVADIDNLFDVEITVDADVSSGFFVDVVEVCNAELVANATKLVCVLVVEVFVDA
jgi:hypothetical protein